jgi:signal transduction histidine kinase
MNNKLSITVKTDDDILLARQHARRLAELLHFEVLDQSRISTATSELARDMILHTGGGEIQFSLQLENPNPIFNVTVHSKEPAALDRIIATIEGRAKLRSEQGIGFVNAKRLMDQFSVQRNFSDVQSLSFGKILNRNITTAEFSDILKKLESSQLSATAEIHVLTQELVQTIDSLRQRVEENNQLTSELEETNRGVVALYAELDENAESLRKADQLKSRFLSHMSHEFRTPLSSILGLSKLLLDRTDGDLTSEQEKQIKFILNAAQGLLELVNDLLDLAKIEAGKTEVQPNTFAVADLLGALRGMFRPIQLNSKVSLVIEDASAIPSMHTDEAKLSQILRNFISNALKFTEEGEVRVNATANEHEVIFSVTDTGIGIAAEDQKHLFQEFSQLNSALHKKAKGSGLGLALCRKLAELLGGSVQFKSEPGKGSTFFANIPIQYRSTAAEVVENIPKEHIQVDSRIVLIVDDDEASRYLIRSWFINTTYSLIEASSAIDGLSLALNKSPDLIVLDLNMPGMNGFEFLRIVKNDSRLSHIPVIVNSSKVLEDGEERFLRTRAAAVLSKENLSREKALNIVNDALSETNAR